MNNSLLKEDNLECESLSKLKKIVQDESFFRIQIFSLESVEIFEKFLKGITYEKQFSSKLTVSKKLVLLLRDSELPEELKSQRIILYSCHRDNRFIPYKFKLNNTEMKSIITDSHISQIYKGSTLTAAISDKLDVYEYTANSLNYIQSLVVFCLIRTSNFKVLCKEIEQVDNSLTNKFIIKCEINSLLKTKIIKKSNNSYSLNISKETIQRICEKLGFGKALHT